MEFKVREVTKEEKVEEHSGAKLGGPAVVLTRFTKSTS